MIAYLDCCDGTAGALFDPGTVVFEESVGVVGFAGVESVSCLVVGFDGVCFGFPLPLAVAPALVITALAVVAALTADVDDVCVTPLLIIEYQFTKIVYLLKGCVNLRVNEIPRYLPLCSSSG